MVMSAGIDSQRVPCNAIGIIYNPRTPPFFGMTFINFRLLRDNRRVCVRACVNERVRVFILQCRLRYYVVVKVTCTLVNGLTVSGYGNTDL